MMSRTKNKIGFAIFECPFVHSCVLPKNQGICRIPECKICSEYIIRLKKLKSRTLH